jgi:hypothetical protein
MVRWLVGILVAGWLGSPAAAGWISIKNSTTQTVIVQELVQVNGSTRKCRPIKLAPGEVLREHHLQGGTKTLTVSEPGLFGQQLFRRTLTWTTDIEFAIHKSGEKLGITDLLTLKNQDKLAQDKLAQDKVSQGQAAEQLVQVAQPPAVTKK